MIVLATIGILPIIWGGGQAWWFSASLLLLVFAFAVWQIGIWWMGDGTYRVQFSWGALLFALPLGVGLFQWLPLGDAVRALSPAAARYWDAAAALPWGGRTPTVSLAPDITLRYCGLYLGCLIIFLLLSSLARHRRYMIGVLCAVVTAAVGNVAQYFVQSFSGNTGIREITGGFLNRNHFGFLMTMGILSASGLLAIVAAKSSDHHYDKRNRVQRYEHPQALAFLLSFVIFLLIVAQVLCLSRGAFLTAMLGLVAFWGTWAYRWQRRHHHSTQQVGWWHLRQSQLMVPAILLVGALCVALPWVLEALSERYAELLTADGLDSARRLTVWKVSLELFRHFGLLGVGLGGYGVAVQPLEQGAFPRAVIEHAHNDFLEQACEIGLPAAIFLVVLGIVVWKRWLHVVLRQHDVTYHWAGLAALVAVACGAAHELVEFNLLAWPNAFCFTALLAVAAACHRVHREESRKVDAKAAETAANSSPAVPETVSAAVASGETAALSGDDAVFVDPAEVEHRLHREERHRRHELFRQGRWRGRLANLAFALAVLLVGCPLLLRCLRSAMQVTRMSLKQDEMRVTRGQYFWGTSTKDYERLQAMATAALQNWISGYPAVLVSRAETRQELARLTEELAASGQLGQEPKWNPAELRSQALEDLSEACRRLPGQGEYAFKYARALEQSMHSNQADLNWPELLAVYEWALSRQPGIAGSVREVAGAYTRAWVWAVRNRHDQEAAEYHQRAIDGYLHSLDLQASSWTLTRLQLLQVPLDEILSHVSSGSAQLRFFRSLLGVQDYATAAKVLEVLSNHSPDPELFPPAEWRLRVTQARCQLSELTGDLAAHAQYWQDYRAAEVAYQNLQLEEYRRLKESGEDWLARDLLKQLDTSLLPNAEVELTRALLLRSHGRPEELVLALLPLAYRKSSPSAETLDAALECLNGVRGLIPPTSLVFLRMNFLEAALTLRRHLEMVATEESSREAVTAAVRRLEELEASLGGSSRNHWIQGHLIAYYAGQGQEALGNLAAAAADYRLSLRRCPNFLLGVSRLAKLEPDGLTEDQQALLRWGRRLENPIGFLTKGLLWLELETTPSVFTPAEATARCTFALLCTDDINNFVQLAVRFWDSNGLAFRKKLLERQMGGKLLTIRVGELMLVPLEIQPFAETAKRSHRGLKPGNLTVYAGTCVTKAMRLELERKPAD